MTMTNEEILRSFRAAAKPKEQVSILAQLNGCGEEKIRNILTAGGVDGRQLPRKKTAQKGVQKSKGGTMIAVMREEERRLLEQKQELPERIAALQRELEAADGKLDALHKAMELIGEVFC